MQLYLQSFRVLAKIRIQYNQKQLLKAAAARSGNYDEDNKDKRYASIDQQPNDLETDFDYADFIHKATISHPPTLEKYQTWVIKKRHQTYPYVKQWNWKQYEWAFINQVVGSSQRLDTVLRYAHQGRHTHETYKEYASRLRRLLDMYDTSRFPPSIKCQIFGLVRRSVGMGVFSRMVSNWMVIQMDASQGCYEHGQTKLTTCWQFCDMLERIVGPDDVLAQRSLRGKLKWEEAEKHTKRSRHYVYFSSPFEFLSMLRIQYEQKVPGQDMSDGDSNNGNKNDGRPKVDNHANDNDDDLSYAHYIQQAASEHFSTLERSQTKVLHNRHQAYLHIQHWTWKQYESIFVNLAISPSEKMDEVILYAQDGRHKHEPYKDYSRRLHRLVDMYGVKTFPEPTRNKIFSLLQASVGSTALQLMEMFWTLVQKDPKRGPDDTPEYMEMEVARKAARLKYYQEKNGITAAAGDVAASGGCDDFEFLSSPFEFLTKLQTRYKRTRPRGVGDDDDDNYGATIKNAIAIHDYTHTRFKFRLDNGCREYPYFEQRTWKQYECIFVDVVLTQTQKEADVLQLGRLFEMYEVERFHSWEKEDIFYELKRSIGSEMFEQMEAALQGRRSN
ncbi:hypothetical protein BGW39_011573 [Mortierella sp. 14UC]|nr:hypothetical protein BGW39_011573 [Mortierella sp. 14UC]